MGNDGNLNRAWTYINWQKLVDMDVAASNIRSLSLEVEDPEMTFPPFSVTAIIFSDDDGQTGDGLPPKRPATLRRIR